LVLRPAGGAENLIKEANNDAGLAAHPSGRFDVNGNHFSVGHAGVQSELLAHAVQPRAAGRRHQTAAHDSGDRASPLPVRGAKIWRHAGRTGVSYSDHYEEKGVLERLMNRLRRITPRAEGYAPVMVPALR